MKWRPLNTVTGAVAEGRRYFRRIFYEEKLWEEIEKGNHVLLLAPRRLGKSSIVKYMAKNPRRFHICVYDNIQSDKSINEFYRRLCNMIATGLSRSDKFKNHILEWRQKWKIKSISKEGLEIDEKEVDYRALFFIMLNDISKQSEKIVLFLDEFPDVVKKIAKHFGSEDAENLLDDIRKLRHDEKFKKSFILVLLGSVGLHHIVHNVTGRSDKVNDLHKEDLYPLENEELIDFIRHLTEGASMEISDEIGEYIKNKIVHLIPYYLQILLEGCDDILRKEARVKLSIEDIDKAYDILLKHNDYFRDWDGRLSEYFPEKYKYFEKVLTHCAHQEGISIQEIYDISVSVGLQDSFKADVDDVLIADGYLYEKDGYFYFNSPLLRDWWKNRHPLINK
jgi:hypothetical protein